VRVVDAEKLLAFYLREHGFRVVGTTPSDRDTAWVRVIQIAAANIAGPPDYFTRSLLQLDCYAGKSGGQPEAINLALAVREVLWPLVGTRAQGVVSATLITNQTRLPDPDFEPARERVVLTVELYAHPLPEAVAA